MCAAECRTNKWREADEWWLVGGWKTIGEWLRWRMKDGCVCIGVAENLKDRPRERPVLQGVCASRRRRRSRQHCQQLGDLLRVASGVGSDAAAETVD